MRRIARQHAWRIARRLGVGLLAAGLLCPLTGVPSAAGTRSVGLSRPFGRLACEPRDGVVFCPGGLSRRVPSFDGVPLDADLTLPRAGRPPFRLIVLLHGLGGNKLETESARDDGAIDNVTFASHGWAVLSYTARGFGGSCGTALARRGTPACARGWSHLADQRYEVRDTQYLAGLLVDEGWARPGIAVAGVSYGAAQALELAMLKDRIELPSGRFVPFTSPRRHIPMTVAAVYAAWPWDDYASALEPNGAGPGATDQARADRSPLGVLKVAWARILAQAEATGYQPRRSALEVWQRLAASAPGSPPALVRALKDLQRFHSAVGIPPPAGGPAPTAIQSGFTDSLFPVTEALRFADQGPRHGSRSPLLLVFDDVGHPWAQNRPADVGFDDATAIDFLEAVAEHRSPRTGVLVRAQRCPSTTPSGPTQWARSFSALSRSSVTLDGSNAQVVTSAGGDPTIAAALDATDRPLCDPLPATPEPGTATYQVAAGPHGLHVLGGAIVRATLTITGNDPELIGRLWDVAPGGETRQIVELGACAPRVPARPGRHTAVTERVRFELPPNDYVVAPDHRLELELVGSTAGFFLPSTSTFSIRVTNLRATVPLAWRPSTHAGPT